MDTDVIVVGAGPVGLMLAGELRLGGADVVVLERLVRPTTESRASTLHARTMELLDQRGLLKTLGTPPHEPRGHFGGIPLDLGAQNSRFAGQWKVAQTRLEALLGEWASGQGARILREHTLTSLTADQDHVTAGVETPSGPVTLRAAYLVGCDGDQSTVRHVGGFDFPGTPATRELLRCDMTGADVADRRFERYPDGLATAVTHDGLTRLMVHQFDRVPDPHRKPDFDDVVEAWKRVTGEDIGAATPVWINALSDASHLAAQYRRGRVLLAGDAAHRQLPVGGQAVNLGVHDAANLGWKLAAQVAGWAPAGLLDTYHDERHAVGRRVLDNIEAQTRLLLGADVEGLRSTFGELIGLTAVQARLADMIGGLDVRYRPGDHPLVGAHIPHLALASERGRTSTTQLLRAGRAVVLELSGQPRRWAEVARTAAGWRGRVECVRATLRAGAFTRPHASALQDVRTLVLRPDGHVAWAGDRSSDARPALARWFGSPQ